MQLILVPVIAEISVKTTVGQKEKNEGKRNRFLTFVAKPLKIKSKSTESEPKRGRCGK
jgi:hypothetical protein